MLILFVAAGIRWHHSGQNYTSLAFTTTLRNRAWMTD